MNYNSTSRIIGFEVLWGRESRQSRQSPPCLCGSTPRQSPPGFHLLLLLVLQCLLPPAAQQLGSALNPPAREGFSRCCPSCPGGWQKERAEAGLRLTQGGQQRAGSCWPQEG